MKNNKTRSWLTVAVAALLVMAGHAPAHAAQIDVTYIGTWTTAPGSGNPVGAGGPGMATGQRYVVRISYDSNSTVINGVPVSGVAGAQMSTIKLTDASNSLDIFVPMEGLDGGSPFVYAQNESDHFPAFIPNPTLNFQNGSSIGSSANIIGFEFEGDFNPSFAANQNFIEVFNEYDGTTINQVSQILNCADASCASSAIAIRGINSLATAVDLVADAGANVVYSASDLTRTTSSSSTNNELGAFRSDGEDFISATWSEVGGSNLVGSTAGLNNDIAVAIANSGLTSTIDTTDWKVDLAESFTLESDDATTMVSYANANPMLSASATAVASGYNFLSMISDPDEVVNAIIANFEVLTASVLVDGATDATSFFNELLATGSQFETFAALQAAFGTGVHTFKFSLVDLAGAMEMVSFNLDLMDGGGVPSVPAPATLLLMLVGLLGFCRRRRDSSSGTRHA